MRLTLSLLAADRLARSAVRRRGGGLVARARERPGARRRSRRRRGHRAEAGSDRRARAPAAKPDVGACRGRASSGSAPGGRRRSTIRRQLGAGGSVAADADAPAVPAVAPIGLAVTAVRRPPPCARRPRAAQGGGAVVSATPRYHTNPKPDYPIPSLRRREEGIVLLNVLVQTDGTPAAISLNRSCGHPLLDRAALDAVHRWTFEPARAAGVPVSSLVVVPVRFSLAEQRDQTALAPPSQSRSCSER